MSRPVVQGISPRQMVELLVKHRRTWILPMVTVAVIAGLVSLVTPRKWKATQGLLIRPEVAGLSTDPLGKFSDLTEMKTIQETLLELARSKTVVSAALNKVGPPRGWFTPQNWPTAEDIESFRDAMVMTPPGGAEFGKTEVFYLGVLDKDPQRAAALTTALAEALERRTQEIRKAQADSMIAELTKGVDQAQAMLNCKIQQLSDFESSVGADLVDLRSLVNPLGGSSEASLNNLAIKAELRANESDRRQTERLLAELRLAQADPQRLVATPSSLLASQPSVERLKQGLVDSQLTTARLLGNLAPAHPLVLAAQESETQVRQQIHNELASAISGLEIELALSDSQSQALEQRLATSHANQKHLASHRAAYSQLVAAVDNHVQLVDAATTRLADAEGQLAGAQSASVLSRLDDVESGLRPVGPSRSTFVAAGSLVGLLLGLGVIFIQHGPTPLTEEDLDAESKPAELRSPILEFGYASTGRSQATLSDAIAAGFESRRDPVPR